HYLGEILTRESLDDIKKFLGDSSALVRSQAAAALAGFPPGHWMKELLTLANEPVRGVRISATQHLASVPKEIQEKNTYEPGQEFLDFLHLQSDISTGNIALGDYYY